MAIGPTNHKLTIRWFEDQVTDGLTKTVEIDRAEYPVWAQFDPKEQDLPPSLAEHLKGASQIARVMLTEIPKRDIRHNTTLFDIDDIRYRLGTMESSVFGGIRIHTLYLMETDKHIP